MRVKLAHQTSPTPYIHTFPIRDLHAKRESNYLAGIWRARSDGNVPMPAKKIDVVTVSSLYPSLVLSSIRLLPLDFC